MFQFRTELSWLESMQLHTGLTEISHNTAPSSYKRDPVFENERILNIDQT